MTKEKESRRLALEGSVEEGKGKRVNAVKE